MWIRKVQTEESMGRKLLPPLLFGVGGGVLCGVLSAIKFSNNGDFLENLIAHTIIFFFIFFVLGMVAPGALFPSAYICTRCFKVQLRRKICSCGGKLDPLSGWEWHPDGKDDT